MRVMVTGASGFVGAHTVAALLSTGHAVRLLVRSRQRLGRALAPLGVELSDNRVEIADGDVTDPASVEAALSGCGAVLHSAAVYSLHPRDAAVMQRTNVLGTEIVLGSAARLGLDPIVHVSSMVALMGRKGETLSPDTAPGEGGGPYMRTKAESEVIARQLQAQGHPVVISYPGSVWGPDDPNFGETCIGLRFALRRWYTLGVGGGIAVSDIRDLAGMHAALISPGRGPRRFLGPAHYAKFTDLMHLTGQVTGRRLPCLPMPWWSLDLPMRFADFAQRYLPVRIPFNHHLAMSFALAHPVDDSSGRLALGAAPRPLEDTVRDTIAWLAASGYVSRRLAGKAAPP